MKTSRDLIILCGAPLLSILLGTVFYKVGFQNGGRNSIDKLILGQRFPITFAELERALADRLFHRNTRRDVLALCQHFEVHVLPLGTDDGFEELADVSDQRRDGMEYLANQLFTHPPRDSVFVWAPESGPSNVKYCFRVRPTKSVEVRHPSGPLSGAITVLIDAEDRYIGMHFLSER